MIRILEFYRDNCPKCKMMDKLLEEIKDKIKIERINADKNNKLVLKYRIMTVPTILILKDDKVIKEINEINNHDDLIKLIEENR